MHRSLTNKSETGHSFRENSEFTDRGIEEHNVSQEFQVA